MNANMGQHKRLQKMGFWILVILFAIGTGRMLWGLMRSLGKPPPQPEAMLSRELSQLPADAKWSIAVMRNKYLFYKQAWPQGEVTPQTPFALADAGAGFTAYAIGVLYDQKSLRYEDKLRQWFPELSDSFEDLSLLQLLTHTSGIRAEALPADLATLERDPAISRYSQANYELLERVIAKLSGQDYATFVKEKVLAPMEMAHTSFHPDELGGRGQWWASAEDLIQMALSFSSNRIVQMRTQAQILEPLRLGDEQWSEYAQGWSVAANRNFRELQLSGSNAFGNLSLTYYPTRYFWVVVMTNQSKAVFDAEKMGRKISEFYLAPEMRPRPEWYLGSGGSGSD